MLAVAACQSKFIVRSFSVPGTEWREAVADKTAALDARMKGTDERIASVKKAMEVNKEVIEKAAGATEKSVKDALVSFKTDVEKAVVGFKTDMGGFKTEVSGIKTDMEKAVGGIKVDVGVMKTDLKEAMKQDLASLEKVLTAEVASLKYTFRVIERIVLVALTVFIFGPSVKGALEAKQANEGQASK